MSRVRTLLSNPRSRRWARLAGIMVLAWLLMSWLAVYVMTRRPRKPFDEPAPKLSWGRLESLRLKTRDGEELGAWLAEPDSNAPCVLLLHGIRGSRRNCLDRAAIAASQGHAVMLVSLRAHGDSTGEFNDIGFGARHDVIAAVEYLERRRPGRPVIIHGSSMGAAASVFASRELGARVSGYILESPYQDIRTAVWNRTESALPPIVAPLAYLGLALTAPSILHDLEAMSPLRAIDGIPAETPVLIVAGGRDRRARVSEAQALFERVRSHGKLTIFETADHVRFLDTEPDRFRSELAEFLRSVDSGKLGKSTCRPLRDRVDSATIRVGPLR